MTSDGVPSGRRTVDAVTQQRYDKVTRVTKPLAMPVVRKTKSKHRRGSKTSSLTTVNNQTAHYERVPAENPTQRYFIYLFVYCRFFFKKSLSKL